MMKNSFLITIMLLAQLGFCQEQRKKHNDTLISFCNTASAKEVDLRDYFKRKSDNDSTDDGVRRFSVTPMSKRVKEVNGLAFGFGHVENKNVAKQTINGLNIELNPAPAAAALVGFMAIMYLPDIIENQAKNKDNKDKGESELKIKNWDYASDLKLNGVNLSSGCFFTTTSMDGLNISLGNKFKNFNGLSITPLGTISDIQKGFSIGIVNGNNSLTGAVFGVYNQSGELKGMQIGVFNQVKNSRGLQVGVFNKSQNSGFQIGFWNKNKKRSLPILNWS